MQTQQSQNQGSDKSVETTSTEHSSQGQAPAAEEVQPSGNQAATEQAGLEGGGSDDYSLAGPFAGLLLDVMPLATALSMAADYIDNSAVLEWLRAVSDEALLAAAQEDGELVGFLLDAILPVGTGVEITGEMGLNVLAGGELATSAQLMRTDVNQLHMETHPSVKVGLSGGGAGLKVVDAFGNGVEAGAGGELFVKLQTDGELNMEPTAPALLEVMGVAVVDAVIGHARGALTCAMPEVFEPLAQANRPEWQVTYNQGGKAEAKAQVASMDELPSPIIGPAKALVELAGVTMDASALAEASALSQDTLKLMGDGQAMFTKEASLSALAETSGSLSMLVGDGEVAALEAMADLSAEVGGKLEILFDATQVSQGLAEVFSTAVELTWGGGMNADATTEGESLESETSSTTMRYESILAAKDGLFGQVNDVDKNGCEAIPGTEAAKPLSELLAESGGGPSFTETQTVTLDTDRFSAEIGRWADLLGVDQLNEQNSNIISTDSELKLSGELAVTPDDYARAASTGIKVQGDAGKFVAWRDLATAINAARGAGTTPSWLAPISAELEAEFGGDAAMTNARLKGFLGVGAGGEIAGEALEEVSGQGAVTARYLVDKAATEDDIQRLLDAV